MNDGGLPGGVKDEAEARRLLADPGFRAALNAMFDHVAIGSAVRDGGGRIVDFVLDFVNSRSEDGAGRGVDQMTGRRVLDLYPGWAASGLMAAAVGVVETGRPFVVDRYAYQDVTLDGEKIVGHWNLGIVPFGNGYLSITRDVTEQVKEDERLAAAEIEAARSRHAVELLQAVSLPGEVPEVPGLDIGTGYQPASSLETVGGDWYDLFALPGGRLGVVIADVAGHGPAAAGQMVQLRGVVRTLALELVDPGATLVAANRVQAKLSPEGPFATCGYAVVDPHARALCWSSAGHVAPVLAGSSAALLRGSVGPPLGVDPTAAYADQYVPLAEGDSLVWFTDGLVEQRDRGIDESLADLVAGAPSWCRPEAQATAAAVVEARAGVGDDVAVVCVRLKD